jgi:polysaccharide deacetylase family protein (PEP-CTERM system associated)
MIGLGPRLTPGTRPTNAMTVDVEDYFQVQALSSRIARDTWEHIPTRIEANIDEVLGLFDEAQVRATFFTLGWIAERHPRVVRQIVKGGHELASHGWDHTRADAQNPAEFRADVGRARRTLEDIGGVRVQGYRAATFSIGERNLWAFAALESEGYRYSSSINPIRHDLYGMPNAPCVPFQPDGGRLWEFPMTTYRMADRNIPCAGGGYFRLLPYGFYRFGLNRVHRVERRPGIFYFHPWEIDHGQPRVAGIGLRSHLRHYTNLRQMRPRLRRLLREFAWDRMDRVFAEQLGEAQPDGSVPASLQELGAV